MEGGEAREPAQARGNRHRLFAALFFQWKGVQIEMGVTLFQLRHEIAGDVEVWRQADVVTHCDIAGDQGSSAEMRGEIERRERDVS